MLMAHIPHVHDLLSVLKCLGLCWVCKEIAKITWQVPRGSIACSAGGGEALVGGAEVVCVWSGPTPAWLTDNSLTWQGDKGAPGFYPQEARSEQILEGLKHSL